MMFRRQALRHGPSCGPRSKPSKERRKHAVEITPDKQHEFATVAQAEGVSLSVARRLLRVVEGSRSTPSVPTLGRATLEAGKAPTACSRCSTRRPGPSKNWVPPTRFFCTDPTQDLGLLKRSRIDDISALNR